MSRTEEPIEPDPTGVPAQEGGGRTARRVAANTVSNWVGMGAQIIANMFLLSYVYKHVGRDPFAVFRLAITISMFVNYLSFGMAPSVIRLVGESLASGDWKRLSQVMSVAQLFLIGASAVGLVVVALVSALLLGPLGVPPDLHGAAATLFQLAAVSAALNLLYVPYRGALQARQRYDLANGVLVAEILVRVAVIVACFEGGWVGLEVLGLGLAGGSFVGLVLGAVFARLVIRELRISLRRLSRQVARDVFSFGAWATLAVIFRQAAGQAGLPLVSGMLGLGQAALYSIPQMLSDYLQRVVSGMTHTFMPLASGYAVHGQRENLARLYRVGTRVSLIVVAPLVAALVTHGRTFIVHWTGPEMGPAYPVMLLYVALATIAAIGLPAEYIVLGSGSIRGLALTRMAATAVGLAAAVAAALFTDWGLYGVVAALLTPVAVRGAVFFPLQMRRETGVTLTDTFARCVVPPLAAMVVPVGAGLLLRWAWPPDALWKDLVQMGIVGLAYLPAAWFAVMTAEERGLVRRALGRGAGRA